MAKRKSAGVLLYRQSAAGWEVLLVKHGGPFWRDKDAGAWSIPKGEYGESETPEAAARREFHEETGTWLEGPFLPLKPIVQKAGKEVIAFAKKGDLNAAEIKSNTFTIEWPPKSGNWQAFPEVAKAGWFSFAGAKEKINAAQIQLLDELFLILAGQ